jgi:metal-responsive CopG/Arc/MetJ family transcriptional regulator
METEVKNRANKMRCTMSLNADIVERVDKLVESSVFANRSHAAERALRILLKEYEE